jgi:hypothetical protein
MNDAVGRGSLAWIRFGGVLAAFSACGIAQWSIRQHPFWTEATVALVIAAAAAALLLGPPTDSSPDARRGPDVRGRHLWLGLGIAVAGFGSYALAFCLLTLDWFVNFDVGAPVALGGLAIWTAGLAVVDRGNGVCSQRRRMSRTEVALLVLIVALGFFLRFYRYDYFPPPGGVCAVEEPQAGQATWLIIHEGHRPWEFVGDRWLPVPFFRVFGESLTAARVPFSIVSGLTVLALYILLRQLVSVPAALFGTALAAMSSWNLIYARLAHNIFATTLVVVVVLALCARAHRVRGLTWYPLIGFLSGYTLYTYAGYRGTPAFAALFLGLVFLDGVRRWLRAANGGDRHRQKRRVVVQAVGLGLALLAFAGPLIAMLPRLQRENAGFFFEAVNRSILNTSYYTSEAQVFVSRVVRRVQMSAKLFNHYGDGSETFNLPGEPMLEPVSGTLFVVGLVYCIFWWRHRWQGFFALMFLALMVVGTVLVGNFDPRRLQGVVPLVFVLIAFVADRFGQAATARLGRRARPLLVGVAVVLLGAALRNNYDVYFTRMIHEPRVRAAFQNNYTVMASHLQSLPDDAYLIAVSDVSYFFRMSDLSWIRGNRVPGEVSLDLWELFAGQKGAWAGRDLRILLQEPFARGALVSLLQRRFRGAQCEEVHPAHVPAYRYMSACRIPSPELATGFAGGAHARYFRGDEPAPFLERREPVISYAFVPEVCSFPVGLHKPPCRVEWEGVWRVPHTGEYALRAEARRGRLEVTVDGQAVSPKQKLTAGEHVIRARTEFVPVRGEHDHTGARLQWRRHAEDPWQFVEFAEFGHDNRAVAVPD